MHAKLLEDDAGLRFHILVLEAGEEAVGAIARFADAEGLTAASFTALGAFERAVVGYFDWDRKEYLPIRVDEQCEVVSLVGDIAVDDQGKPSVHPHAVLGLRDGSTRGGHLLEGHVRPTLEISLTATPALVRRRKRPDLGVALIDLG